MKRAFFITTLGVILACCTPMQMDQMEYIDYSVEKQETADFSDLDNFDPLLKDFKDFLFFLDKKMVFRVAAISYQTVDPNGQPVKASGLVFHPLNKKSKGVIDFLPTAHMDSEGGGTDELYAIEGILILLGYTVIIPDLLGSGISKDMQIPFLMAENTGRVAYDMRRAAAQYLWDEFRYVFPYETTIMGYSLGGSAALATQKYYESRHANTVKIKEVHASSGAYDLVAAFEAFAKSGYSDYPAIPNIILAFKRYYFDDRGLEFDISQIFKGDLLANYQDWYGGQYTSPEIMEKLGTNLRAYLHEDFFKPFDQQNETIKSLHPYLKENSVSEGWRPKAPIYMSHAKVDTYVPIECAEVAVKNLRRAGANISFISYPGDHLTVGALWFVRSLIRFL
ncbi:MAG: hypothetical protein FWD56_02570 [Bacteroidales bacterium]|nr:hypothetical protein [Bacteroidales bacterium]